MTLRKYATATIISAEIAQKNALGIVKASHRAVFDYEPKPGFLYVRSRMISSRCNDNHDEFPAEEIKAAWKTALGKPAFVNHHNEDHRRMRGVIIDAALHEDTLPTGEPDTWIEALHEIDAVRFPKLAQAILSGRVNRTSMGCDVGFSVCSACGNKASTPAEYCQHIPAMKGRVFYRHTASGNREGQIIREICHKLSFFENSFLVEDPADPTAVVTGVDDRGLRATAKKDPRFEGVGLKQDDEGWYVQTHRARSDSYETPEDIPESKIEFIRSTGNLSGRVSSLPEPGKDYLPWRDRPKGAPSADPAESAVSRDQTSFLLPRPEIGPAIMPIHPFEQCVGCGADLQVKPYNHVQRGDTQLGVCNDCQKEMGIGVKRGEPDYVNRREVPRKFPRETMPILPLKPSLNSLGHLTSAVASMPGQESLFEVSDEMRKKTPLPVAKTKPNKDGFARGETLGWDAIGSRHPQLYGNEEIHGEEAYGADGEGIGWAANQLAHATPADPEAEKHSVWDLDFHSEEVDPQHIDHARHGSTDSRVAHARQGYQDHPSKVPPLVLVHRHGVYQVADGHHRAEAAKLAKRKVRAYVAYSPYPDEPSSDGDKAPYHGAETNPGLRSTGGLFKRKRVDWMENLNRPVADLNQPLHVLDHLRSGHGWSQEAFEAMSPGENWQQTHERLHREGVPGMTDDQGMHFHGARAQSSLPSTIEVEAAKYNKPTDHPFFKSTPVHPDNIIAAYDEADESTRAQGMRWYADAHHIAKSLDPDGDAHRGAGVLAAYSPRTAWPINLFNASRTLQDRRAVRIGEGMNVMGMHAKAAARLVEEGNHYFQVFKTPKITDFAHLIAHGGDDEECANCSPHKKTGYPKKAVVVDRHALSVAAGRRMSDKDIGQAPLGTRRFYEHVAEQFRKAADQISHRDGEDVHPHQVQAITWLQQQKRNAAEDEAQGFGGRGRQTRDRNAWSAWEEHAQSVHPGLGEDEGNIHMRNPHRKKESGLMAMALRKGAPFAGYDDFEDCEDRNQDKDDPSAYCGEIKKRTEGRLRTLAELSDEDIHKGLGLPTSEQGHKDVVQEKAKALGDALIAPLYEPYGGHENYLLHMDNESMQLLQKRYRGGTGRFAFDEEAEKAGERAEPYYEIKHTTPQGRETGWTIRHYADGPYAEIRHAATPGEAHDMIDIGRPIDSSHNTFGRHQPPEDYGHNELAGDLHDWADKDESGSREHLEGPYGDPRIRRFKQRYPQGKLPPRQSSLPSTTAEMVDPGMHCLNCGREMMHGTEEGELRTGPMPFKKDTPGLCMDCARGSVAKYPKGRTLFYAEPDSGGREYSDHLFRKVMDENTPWRERPRGFIPIPGVEAPKQSLSSLPSTVSYGETKAPADVDTLRDESCPVCGESDSFDGNRCEVCHFVQPPSMFTDPDTSVARQMDLKQEEFDQGKVGPNGELIPDVDDQAAMQSAEEGMPGTPGDQIADLFCPACGFSADTQEPMTNNDPSAPPENAGLMEGDVCPNCEQATMLSPNDVGELGGEVPQEMADDADADSVPDDEEADANGDGIPDDADLDQDGVPDLAEQDADGDGIPDSDEGPEDPDADRDEDQAAESDDSGDGNPVEDDEEALKGRKDNSRRAK